jgi:hypothetical protein
MEREFTKYRDDTSRVILLLAECWLGALDAGRFAARMMFDDSTRIILLNTYQQPPANASMMRSVVSVLKQTAEKDLEIIRESLVNNFGVPAENVESRVAEGTLRSVIERDFGHISNLSIVLGQNIHNPFRKGSCSKIIKMLIGGSTRPIFLVSEHITLIETSRIVVIAENEDTVSNVYIRYLADIHPEENIEVEIVTCDNTKKIELDRTTVMHLSKQVKAADFSRGSPEHMFFDNVIIPGT